MGDELPVMAKDRVLGRGRGAGRWGQSPGLVLGAGYGCDTQEMRHRKECSSSLPMALEKQTYSKAD